MINKCLLFLTAVLISLSVFSEGIFAEEELTSLRLKTDFNIWRVNLARSEWVNEYSKYFWNGFEVRLPEYLEPALAAQAESYLEKKSVKGLDFSRVKSYLEKYVAPEIHREKQDVNISVNEENKVIFEGFAMSGQEIDYEKAFYVIRQAFFDQEEDVRLPIRLIKPLVRIQSDDLKTKGITDLISTGETDFSGSPRNRRNNIRTGLASFNGYLLPSAAESSAGRILGRVDASTGYLPELVIKGDKTIPEYGGGLCQVSTTVYRSLLFGGFPITERKNHSYAVSYYDPQGLDATIYPPSPDLKFINDTPGYILLQTAMIGDKAYANIYGTPVDRHVDLIGPWYYDHVSPPPPKTELSSKLPPGKKEIAGAAHGGFKARWYRRITHGDPAKKDIIELIYSYYEARPQFTIVGTGAEAPKAAENGT